MNFGKGMISSSGPGAAAAAPLPVGETGVAADGRRPGRGLTYPSGRPERAVLQRIARKMGIPRPPAAKAAHPSAREGPEALSN